MGVRTKTLVTVLLVGAVIGVLALQTQNKSLFKGQIFKDPAVGEDADTDTESGSGSGSGSNADDGLLPDLRANIVIEKVSEENSDLKANVTIENLGPGKVVGNELFKYSVYLNDIEVFSNIDSYTEMNAGDSFNFIYPISRLVYNYPDSGKAKVVIDSENKIDEANEENNSIEVSY